MTERLLKTSIPHRKNSLHYRTVRGAHVGDLFMSLIKTCHANGVNPFDYLLTAVGHAKAVATNPAACLPWNYPQAMPAG